MTEAEICERLNLRDPDEYALEARWRAVDFMAKEAPRTLDPLYLIHRRTGRTTRSVVRALAIMSRGEWVLFGAPDEGMLHVALVQLEVLARSIGIRNLVHAWAPGCSGRGVAGHAVWDDSCDYTASGAKAAAQFAKVAAVAAPAHGVMTSAEA